MDQQPTFNIIQGLRFLSVTLLLLVAGNTFASSHFPLPENHQSTYSVIKYGTEVGEINNNFQHQDQHISYTSKATPKGAAAFFLNEAITETSYLYWPDDDTLKTPQQTSYTLHHTRKKKKDQKISFAWPNINHVDISSTYRKKQVTLSTDENVWSSQLLPILMSSHLLLDNKTKSNRFLIVNKNSLKYYDFTLQGHEVIKLKQFKQLK